MRKPRVVLDTNVIVSAHLNSTGLERYVLDLALSGRIRLIVSDAVWEEYAAVLYRPKFKIPPQMVSTSLQTIRQAGRWVRPKRPVSASVDPKDNKFLECAEAADADYLVTGNKRHFPATWKRTRILSARELLNLFVPDVPGSFR